MENKPCQRSRWNILLDLLHRIVNYLDFNIADTPADKEYILYMKNLLIELDKQVRKNKQ